jgi:hypothetical protein
LKRISVFDQRRTTVAGSLLGALGMGYVSGVPFGEERTSVAPVLFRSSPVMVTSVP